MSSSHVPVGHQLAVIVALAVTVHSHADIKNQLHACEVDMQHAFYADENAKRSMYCT